MKLAYNLKSFIFQDLVYKLMIIFQLSQYIKTDCNITHPVLKNNNCYSIYCSPQDYNSSVCTINNSIAKIQWLTNIMPISEINFRFIHPFLTKNKDFIIQTTSVLIAKTRRYFGLTNEGRYYFNDSKGEETPYYSIDAKGSSEDELLYKFEGTAASVQFENDDNDYFLSVGNKDSYAELIDYKENTITRKLSEKFYYVYIVSEISSIFPLTITPNDINDHKKYYLIPFIILYQGNHYFMCKIYYFNSTDITNGYERVSKIDKLSVDRKIISCFQSQTTYYIFCFYQNVLFYFQIIVLEPSLNLNSKIDTSIDLGENGDENEFIFFKGIYLINNTGFYLYYKSISSNPTIAIKEWNGSDEIKDYNFNNFTLDKFDFNANVVYNDLININSNQICFTTISPDKKIIYIIIFHFYQEYTKMMIRYYTIKLYELYNKKILLDLRLNLFGNFISLTSSFCSNDLCDSNSNEHYSYLIIFSYPNFTDIDFDLIQHLKYTNDNITNINIDLTSYKNYSKIDNNIFGYYYKGIKILSVPDNLKAFSLLYNTEIKGNYSLINNENISISISLEDQKIKDEYIIKLAIIVSEPDYINLKDYITDIDISKGDENENLYYTSKEYIGKTSYFRIIKDGFLSTDCKDEECSLCREEDNDKCITCKNDFTLEEEEKICKTPIKSTIPIKIFSSILNTQSSSIDIKNLKTSIIIYDNNKTEEINKCSKDLILNKNCNEIITDEQIRMIYGELKNILNNNYTNESIILLTKNVAFQLSTLEEQNKQTLETIFISNVDIGDCQKLIKKQENLKEEDVLIILKADIKSEDNKATYVQYEIYTPNKTKVDLKVCQNTSIFINTPIKLSQEFESLYNSLNESGYNLFNSNDSFYNDICSPYTSEKGIDIPMIDRQNEIYTNMKDYSICQKNCTFLYYNSTNKKSKCDCKVQIEETIIDTKLINFKDELIGSFYITLKNSNFLVLKCFKLTFSIKGQTHNIGSYVMSILFLILIFFIIIHYVTSNKKLKNIMKDIILRKKNLNNIEGLYIKKGEKLKFNKVFDTEIMDKIENKDKNKNKKKAKKQRIKIENNIFKTSPKKSERNKVKRLKIKNGPPPKRKNFDKINKRSSFIIMNRSNSKNKIIDLVSKDEEKKFGYTDKCLKKIIVKKGKDKKKNKKSKFDNISFNDTKINNKNIFSPKKFVRYSSSGLIKEKKKKYNNKNLDKINKKNNTIENYNNQELNDLNYNLAIDLDKRTYFQYYFSLLKKKHMILFTFFPSDDYNLRTMKISLFLLTFSLYFTIDGFFFTDETMHNIYINNGAFQFLYQIPLILYSSFITSFIHLLLKYLSLSENSIIKLKNENNIDSILQKAKEIEKILKIKFIIFYICSFIFMSFFWYFISSFCAVYKNTQIILFKDTLLSFLLAMLYPLGLNLLPGFFRIPAVRSPKRDKECLYKISNILALI